MVIENEAPKVPDLIKNLDGLSVAAGSSFVLLFLVQSNLANPEHGPALRTISIVVLASCLALSELRRRRAKDEIESLREAAVTDPLTGIGNRRWLEIEVKKRLSQFRRKSVPFSLMMIEVDCFETINEDWGLNVGDLVLKALANAFQVTLREMDVLCRLGGDRFVIVLPETNIKQACIAADRTRRAAEQLDIPIGLRSISVTVSIGVTAVITSESGRCNDTLEQVFQRADDALYAAKKFGYNRVFAKSSLTSGSSEITAEIIRAAISSNTSKRDSACLT